MNRLDCCIPRTTGERAAGRGFSYQVANPFRESIDENADAFVLTLDLPGIRKEELKVELKDRLVSLTVTPSDERPFVSAVHRAWKTGPELDPDQFTARFENGVLELVLPKRKPTVTEPRTLDIQ